MSSQFTYLGNDLYSCGRCGGTVARKDIGKHLAKACGAGTLDEISGQVSSIQGVIAGINKKLDLLEAKQAEEVKT